MKSNCVNCNNEFNYYPSQSEGKYCSNSCQQQIRKQTILEEWLSGSYFNKKGNPPDVAKQWISEQQNHSCLMCGIKSWNSKPIVFQYDHIDGNPDHNVKENIRMLCPNCHSQTDTYGVKNKKSKDSYRNVYRRSNYHSKKN